MGGVAVHPNGGDAAPVAVVDFRDGRPGNSKLRLADQSLDLVHPPGFQRVVDGGEEQLLRGEGVVGFVLD